jgi:hypothetical protein
MNKMKIMLAALLCSTAVLADEPKGLDKILPAVSDYSGDTDAAFLEAHQPLLKAPEEGAEKDAKYWAEAVGSRLKVTGYAQGGYTATFQEGNSSANTNTFDMKRIILMVGANITKEFYAFFMHEFKGGNVMEYYMEYRPTKAFNLRLGQSKTELSMENPMSPTVLESITPMSQSVGWLCGGDPLMSNGSGRDMGLMAYGSLFNNHLLYELAVMNGQGINRRDGNNYKDLIAKLDFRPIDGFRVVCSAQKGKGHAVGTAAWNPGVALGDDYTRDRVSVGAEWKMPTTAGAQSASGGVSIRGEFMAGKDGDVHSQGGYLTGCVPIGKGVDIVASADYFDRNTDMDYAQTQLTGGIQYWFFKKCRLQLQYTRTFSDFQDDYNWLQAQVQVAF